jgi:hypothetical protein
MTSCNGAFSPLGASVCIRLNSCQRFRSAQEGRLPTKSTALNCPWLNLDFSQVGLYAEAGFCNTYMASLVVTTGTTSDLVSSKSVGKLS